MDRDIVSANGGGIAPLSLDQATAADARWSRLERREGSMHETILERTWAHQVIQRAMTRFARSAKKERRLESPGSRAGATSLLPVLVERKPPAQPLDFLLHHAERAVIIGRRQHPPDQLGDQFHLRFPHAPRRDSWSSNPNAAGNHRRVLIERNRILVDGDPGFAECGFRH